jgi:hypothetical protein
VTGKYVCAGANTGRTYVRQRTELSRALAYPRKPHDFRIAKFLEDPTMGANADYIARMKTQLKRWDEEVDALAARCERADAEVRDLALEQIKDLRARRDVTQKAYQQMRAAGESAGGNIKVELESAWVAMQKALGRLSAR